MKVIFTCGGTGGHIYPAIAVAKLLQERHPDCEILFIGAEDGMENRIVPREGFRLETLKISNYQRSFTPKAVWHNVTTLLHMSGSMRKAKAVIRAFGPDVIVGTGGYASFPALKVCGFSKVGSASMAWRRYISITTPNSAATPARAIKPVPVATDRWNPIQ